MARYVGGPCDGRNAGVAIYGTTYCGGVNYTMAEDGNYHYGTGFAGSRGTTIFGLGHVFKAWSALMRSVGVGTHHAVTNSRGYRARIRRAVR